MIYYAISELLHSTIINLKKINKILNMFLRKKQKTQVNNGSSMSKIEKHKIFKSLNKQ